MGFAADLVHTYFSLGWETDLALLALAGVLVLIRRWTIGGQAMARYQDNAMRWRMVLMHKPGPGFANTRELTWNWSRWAAIRAAKYTRPSYGFWARYFRPVTDCSIYIGRAQWFKRVFAPVEDMILLLGGPRSGKTRWMARLIRHWAGPALVASSRADLCMLTSGARGRRGHVHVFNPYQIGGIPSTFVWAILGGCEDVSVAIRRSMDLTGEVSAGDMGFWQNKAAVCLAGYLHAAALMPGTTIADVYAWSQRHGDALAEQELKSRANRDNQAGQAYEIFASVIAEVRLPTKSSDSVRMTLTNALGWAAVPELLAATTSGDVSGFDPITFATSTDTVYIISKGGEGAETAAPLIRALTSDAHYQMEMVASYQQHGKLEPYALIALDEVHRFANVAVDHWVADSAGNGITVVLVAQDTGQLEDGWGKNGFHTIWGCTLTKFVMPGLQDDHALRMISDLFGDIDGDRIVPTAAIRKIPKRRALIMRGNLAPVVARIPRAGRDAPDPVLAQARYTAIAARRNAYTRATVPLGIRPLPGNVHDGNTGPQPIITGHPADVPAVPAPGRWPGAPTPKQDAQ